MQITEEKKNIPIQQARKGNVFLTVAGIMSEAG
jgi:hypothetical protein